MEPFDAEWDVTYREYGRVREDYSYYSVFVLESLVSADEEFSVVSRGI